jgi:hypothetical protein
MITYGWRYGEELAEENEGEGRIIIIADNQELSVRLDRIGWIILIGRQ